MDEETTFKFIECIQSNECLWNITSKAYKNKKLRDDIWTGIRKQFSGEEAYGNFRKMREKYRREKDKETGRSGSGSIQKSTWPFLRVLTFLDAAYKKRKVSASQWEEEELFIELDDEGEECTITPVKSASKTPLKSGSKTPSDNKLTTVLKENTQSLIAAINMPVATTHELIPLIEATLNTLDTANKKNYEKELLQITMKYRYNK